MAFENGFDWRPVAPDQRGRHGSLSSALDAAFKDLTAERGEFFESLADSWTRLFPSLPATPGRCEGGRIFVYVRSASAAFMVRPRLRAVAARLAQLPGAPKRIDLRLEIHA